MYILYLKPVHSLVSHTTLCNLESHKYHKSKRPCKTNEHTGRSFLVVNRAYFKLVQILLPLFEQPKNDKR